MENKVNSKVLRRIVASTLIPVALCFVAACAQPSTPSPDPGTPNVPDPTLPGGLTAVSASPATTGPIELYTTFIVTFDKSISSSTISKGLRLLKGNTEVAGVVTHSVYSSTELRFKSAVNLEPGTAYTLEATTTTRATDGSSLTAAVRWEYVTKNPLIPSISILTSTYSSTPLADGVWINKDVYASASRSYTYNGGILSILWSVDGVAWNESATSSSNGLSNVSIATTDGTQLQVKSRFVYNGVTYDSNVFTANVDKTSPRVISYTAPSQGKLNIVMSEPIYKSTALDAPDIANFHMQSMEHWDAAFTITNVSGSGTDWSLDYTYCGSNGDHIQITSAGMDRAGNSMSTFYDTEVATIKEPTAIQASVTADGTISVTGVTGTDFGDGFAAAVPTISYDTYGLLWTSSVGGASIVFSGLNPETRYYVEAANTIGTVGRSRGVKVYINRRNYLYPVKLFDEGSGTEADPWIVRNRADLECMLDDAATRDDNYRLGADLDFSHYEWTSVGTVGSIEFTGGFDGAGHSITGGASAPWNGGIIAVARNATIRDILVKNVTIDGNYSPQGAIVNMAYGSTTIERAAVEGLEITSGGSWSGGIVGRAGFWSEHDNASVIRHCYAQGRVVDSGQGRVGGIAGYANGATIEDCFAAVDIANTDEDNCAGLVGEVEQGTTIRRAFASGDIDTKQCGAGLVCMSGGTPKPVLESLIAMNPSVGKTGYTTPYDGRKRVVFMSINNYPLSNYVTFSGLYAYSDMKIDGATVTESDENGTGISLADFKSSSSACFTGWDFSSTWIMSANGPTLRGMPLGAGVSGTPTLDPIAWD